MAARVNKKDKREQDEIERLERENRELKSINRSMLKQLKKLAKGIHRQEIEETLEKLEDHGQIEKDPDKRKCPECSRNGLTEVVLAGRRFQSCSVCQWKSGRIK